MFSGFNFLGKRDVKEPDFAYAPNAERLGIKFEHNAANAPVALNGSLKIEETRAVPGISAKLNTIAKIRGEYVIASKYDFWFLNADLSPSSMLLWIPGSRPMCLTWWVLQRWTKTLMC